MGITDFMRDIAVPAVTAIVNSVAIKDFNDVQELGRFVLVHDENICAGGIITQVA